MRVILCDDDPAILARLEEYLAEYFGANGLPMPELSVYRDGGGLLAREEGSASPADIAFLDVEMPGASGIDAGARLAAGAPRMKIFIVTSYPDYLDDAMRFHVFRYLSKPLDKARLFRNLKDALCQLSVDTRPVLIETPEESATLRADEIVAVEAQGRGTQVQTVDRLYRRAQPIGYWEEVLLGWGGFFRPHRSFIINMKYVRRFSSNLITLCAPDGREYTAYLTRRRYKDFKDSYMLYVEAMR